MFAGRSLLREKEAKPAAPVNKALQDYLQKYKSGAAASDATKKKKKKKKPAKVLPGVRIVDQDVTGFGTVLSAAAAEEDEDDEAPVIANEEEAERARRQIEKLKQGTGWEAADVAEPAVRRRHESDADASPVRRPRHDSDADDASPPRRRQRHNSDAEDASLPCRRQRHDLDAEDASPPRRRQRHDSDAEDASPPRRRQRHDSDADDASPPRRSAPGSASRARHDSDSDASPPRRGQTGYGDDADASPHRRRKRAASSDLSPARKRAQLDADASPPRRPSVKTMTDGTASGMVSGKQLAVELAAKKEANRKRMAALDASVTGRNAQTVHRDKSGKVVTEEELKAARDAEREKKEWETPEWGGGVKQQQDVAKARAEMRAAAAQPFARTREHLDADVSHRERVRWGDPMAHLARKKLKEGEPPPVLSPAQQKKMGFVVPQQVPAHSWLKRNLGAPPNRYGIRPGRHWDGVDRSNGFERELFKTQNVQAARNAEARAFGQEDM